ncbi:hypothetical protein [Ottowia sp.]|uniref:hypothetical protein n=1 Tax=Ottowia sp. TaxID=1898956 RepID=UPI0039E32E55
MNPRTILMRLALALALSPMLWAPLGATAQNNSSQAIEAARKHRAETGGQRAAAPEAAAATPAGKRPYQNTNDPGADPNASLRSCLNHVGMNVAARDRCMRQHCTGRWGQGDCPASGGNVIGQQPTGSANTPLGRCLREAGNNPFRRDGCGWRICKGKRETSAECAAFYPPNPSN